MLTAFHGRSASVLKNQRQPTQPSGFGRALKFREMFWFFFLKKNRFTKAYGASSLSSVSTTLAEVSTPGNPAPGWVPAPTR
jgi:hypothetical protein